MLEYPSILGWRRCLEHLDEPCYAFIKYDGSNLRFEWTPKQGWFKHGTRHQLFDQNTPLYGPAVQIFNDRIGDGVVEQIRQAYGKKVERITAFCEFFGPNSFAGTHQEGDLMTLRLFDVSVFKKGFISPKEFSQLFNADWAAQLDYKGPLSQEFIDSVRNGQNELFEGVVCKGGESHGLWRTKVKSVAYLERLKASYPSLYAEEKELG